MNTVATKRIWSEYKVSVIIPAYNVSRFVKEAVDSALNQTHRNLEVIVVDDGSKDNTVEILRGYGSKIRLILQANQGSSAARNHGIRESTGDVIAFLDADDAWLPDKLERQLKVYQKNPNVGMVTCGTYFVNAVGKVIDQRQAASYSDPKKSLRRLRIRNTIVGGPSSVMVARRCFDEVGFFNQKMNVVEDWEMWLRIASKFDIDAASGLLMRYRFHSNNIHKHVEDMIRGQRKVLRVHGRMMSWLDRRRAYSFLYQDAATEYLKASQRTRAVINIFRAIRQYPFKLQRNDDRYAILVKCIIPGGLRSMAKRFWTGHDEPNGYRSCPWGG